jgi:hypothetical protein
MYLLIEVCKFTSTVTKYCEFIFQFKTFVSYKKNLGDAKLIILLKLWKSQNSTIAYSIV